MENKKIYVVVAKLGDSEEYTPIANPVFKMEHAHELQVTFVNNNQGVLNFDNTRIDIYNYSKSVSIINESVK